LRGLLAPTGIGSILQLPGEYASVEYAHNEISPALALLARKAQVATHAQQPLFQLPIIDRLYAVALEPQRLQSRLSESEHRDLFLLVSPSSQLEDSGRCHLMSPREETHRQDTTFPYVIKFSSSFDEKRSEQTRHFRNAATSCS
jgi:hypothetical protein